MQVTLLKGVSLYSLKLGPRMLKITLNQKSKIQQKVSKRPKTQTSFWLTISAKSRSAGSWGRIKKSWVGNFQPLFSPKERAMSQP